MQVSPQAFLRRAIDRDRLVGGLATHAYRNRSSTPPLTPWSVESLPSNSAS